MVSLAIQQIGADQAAQQADITGIKQKVTQAIQVAAAKTGVDFAYLLNKAQQESGGDPNAKASNSTATGLFQFTGQTWLKMIKSSGAQYGLSNYANHIQIGADGTAHVSDATWRKAILGLRKDPQISAEMAGELDKENGASLKATVGGKIGPTELYLAHFLGAGGASEFLNTLHDDPSAKAADILPDAAAANSSVFYNSDGEAKSVAQIYQHFAKKFDRLPTTQPATTPSATMVASAASSPSTAQPIISAPLSSTTASSYIVADNKAASSVYAASAINGIKSESSSLFATMVLAQMKMSDITSSTSTPGTSAYNKKNAISILGAIA